MGCVSASLAILLVAFPAPQADGKAKPPDEAAQKKILKEIKELFKDGYAKRDLESRKSLALGLLEQGDQSLGDPATAYVLLTEASALAAEAGDAATALAALGKIGERFEAPDLYDVMLDTLGKAVRTARTPDQARSLARGYLGIAREAAAAGDFDSAQDAVKKAGTLARKARDRGLAAEATAYGKVVPELKRERAAFEKADLSGAIDIGNTKANLDIGRVLLFVKGDVTKGLEFLQYAGKGGIAGLARKELAGPADGAAKAALGLEWWALAGKERNALHKKRYAGRARDWLEKADLEVEGLEKVRIAKTLGDIEDAFPGGPVNLLRLVQPATHSVQGAWSVERGALRCGQAEAAARVRIPYAPPDEYDLHAVVERINSHDAIVFGLVSGGRTWLLRIDSHPDKGYLTGVELVDGKFQDQHPENVMGRRIENGRTYSVDISVRKGEVSLSIDGAAAYGWKGDFQRLGPSSLWPMKDARSLFVGGWGGGVAFKELRIRPVSGPGEKLR